MQHCLTVLSALFLLIAIQPCASADDQAGVKYDLQYKFQPGEIVRWDVEHRATIRTTVSGTTQTAETLSRSVKVWRVKEINDAGEARFEHLVESVDMRQKLTGRQEVRYKTSEPAGTIVM